MKQHLFRMLGMFTLVMLIFPAVGIGAAAKFNPADSEKQQMPQEDFHIYLAFIKKGPIYNYDNMVAVSAGEFQMGCDPAHNGGFLCDYWELPLHTVFLDAYRIDKYEVTNVKYSECVTAGQCPPPASNSSGSRSTYYNNPTYNNYPVTNVSWFNANTYCSWAGKRLPSEAEWEKAARGTSDTRAYPWGDEAPTCSMANYWNGDFCVGNTTEVGSYPLGASPYGVMDMAGNVWEWINDWYSADYYTVSPHSNPIGPTSGTSKVFRGDAWNGSLFTFLRLAFRGGMGADAAYDGFGFRCVVSP
jgi:eukaryotic-like serine/threonine-protein kinase